MKRVHVSLTPEEDRRARAKAAELGISFAAYIRRLVAHDLAEPQALFDLGDSGGSDVARERHRYVGEAVQADR